MLPASNRKGLTAITFGLKTKEAVIKKGVEKIKLYI